jgi:predicted dienelactone hydrolase
VPDVRFLLDHLLESDAWDSPARLDAAAVGIVGHSLGGWTALSATAVEWRIRAVVALAPGGNSRPRPGIIPATLSFRWGREVPALYLAAEDDTPIPPPAVHELFARTPGRKRLVVLRRADHGHFIDEVEREHEAVRAMQFPPGLEWIAREMRPIAELCSGAQAHTFVRGLALAHFDATLRGHEGAERFLSGDVAASLAARDVEAIVHAA